MNISEKAKKYAISCHEKIGQTYDGHPYSYHLDKVAYLAESYSYLIPYEDRYNVVGGAWCHDTIEDTGITYNDLMKATNKTVAELVYALTNEKGRNRKERANDKYYKGIRETKYAVLIKLCDRIANVQYSKIGGKTSMFEKYREENQNFTEQLLKPTKRKWMYFLLKIFMNKKNYIEFLIDVNPYKNLFKRLNLIFEE